MVPTEYGVQKNACHCLTYLCKKLTNSLPLRKDKIEMGFLSNFEETSQQEEKTESENQDDASSALYHQPFLNEKQKKVYSISFVYLKKI